jgi:hypothetical protein
MYAAKRKKPAFAGYIKRCSPDLMDMRDEFHSKCSHERADTSTDSSANDIVRHSRFMFELLLIRTLVRQ